MRSLSRIALASSIALLACAGDGQDDDATGEADTRSHGSKLADPVAVLRVIDGDTLEVVLEDKAQAVRVKGIDAPDLHSETVGGAPEPYADAAYFWMQAHVSLFVELEFDSDCAARPLVSCRDAQGRLHAYVRRNDGMDFGRSLLEQGLARVARLQDGTVPRFDRRAGYLGAEATARAQGAGMWGD